MTLNDYITRLEQADPATKVPVGLGDPHSWRGDYAELAFEPVRDTTVGEMLAAARSALGATYQGYKGGEYLMTGDTTIHVDMHGRWSDGRAIWAMLLDLMLDTSAPT